MFVGGRWRSKGWSHASLPAAAATAYASPRLQEAGAGASISGNHGLVWLIGKTADVDTDTDLL